MTTADYHPDIPETCSCTWGIDPEDGGAERIMPDLDCPDHGDEEYTAHCDEVGRISVSESMQYEVPDR